MCTEQLDKKCTICQQTKPLDAFNKHAQGRNGRRSWCRDCQKLRQREYYRKNSARFKEYYRQYFQLRAEERRQYDRERLTKEERREYQRQYRAKHAEKLRDYDRRYNIEKADKKAALSHRRRARKKAAEGTFTEVEWERLKAKYDYKRLCCNKGEPEIRLEPDHIVPLSKGGSNWISNIQPLCKKCNDRKKTQEIDYRSQESSL